MVRFSFWSVVRETAHKKSQFCGTSKHMRPEFLNERTPIEGVCIVCSEVWGQSDGEPRISAVH